ncbi:hypothetical protein BJ912DRAFT_978589 [Pholiota molesta]|nr:hypothetical protein BJ912DRAFT_978589 [Pholiota molesta]
MIWHGAFEVHSLLCFSSRFYLSCCTSFLAYCRHVHLVSSVLLTTLSVNVHAHLAAWHNAMYCLRGNQVGKDDRNADEIVQPLFNVSHEGQWWFHADNNVLPNPLLLRSVPPDAGVFLELPANGNFTVEHAFNHHPDFGVSNDGKVNGSDCITLPNIHAQNQTMVAGTAFAISYQSELANVTPENLVVFSVLYNTPWKRIAVYNVPDLPACPPDGCICAHGWVPNGCGEPNMYMQGFRCNVTGANTDSPRTIQSPAVAPQWCELDSTECVPGAKQMIFWNQADGNNVVVDGWDKYGFPKSPGYNMKMGFPNGVFSTVSSSFEFFFFDRYRLLNI